jgi:hypothetical protein
MSHQKKFLFFGLVCEKLKKAAKGRKGREGRFKAAFGTLKAAKGR